MKRYNCSASWPCLACQVVFERKGFAREMVSNCNVGATTYTVCWVGTDRGAARLTIERSFPSSPSSNFDFRAISIFEIQFAGATTTRGYPKRNFRNSACRLTVEQAGHASPVKWLFERKGFAREMVSNCNVGATTYTVCWVGTDQEVG